MADRGRKKLTTGEAIEAIFADQDSDNDQFDCGSDVEDILHSENDSASEESELDDSITLPHTSYTQTIEKVSKDFTGNFLCI